MKRVETPASQATTEGEEEGPRGTQAHCGGQPGLSVPELCISASTAENASSGVSPD